MDNFCSGLSCESDAMFLLDVTCHFLLFCENAYNKGKFFTMISYEGDITKFLLGIIGGN